MPDIKTLTDAFFDSKRVLAAVKRAERKAFSRAGAFVRRRARSLIGRDVSHKTPPRPTGQPPRSRTGKLKRWILFAYDFSRRSVFVGPAILPRSRGNGIILSSTTVPEALEFGAGGKVTEYKVAASRGGSFWTTQRPKQQHETRRRRITIKPHPTMGPALEKEAAAGTIAAVWKNAVR